MSAESRVDLVKQIGKQGLVRVIVEFQEDNTTENEWAYQHLVERKEQ